MPITSSSKHGPWHSPRKRSILDFRDRSIRKLLQLTCQPETQRLEEAAALIGPLKSEIFMSLRIWFAVIATFFFVEGCRPNPQEMVFAVYAGSKQSPDPLLTKTEVLFFRYADWKNLHETAAAELGELQRRITNSFQEIESVGDATQQQLDELIEAVNELGDWTSECGFIRSCPELASTPIDFSLSRGGLADQVKKREQQRKDITKYIADATIFLDETGALSAPLIDLRPSIKPALTFLTNSSGYVLVQRDDLIALSRENAGAEPDLMDGKWVALAIIRPDNLSERKLPRYAKVVVSLSRPQEKYEIVISSQPDSEEKY